MSNEILIEGTETPEIDEQIRFIEAGLYDLSNDDLEGWFSSIKSVFKKVTKPLTKTLSPLINIAKTATSIPVLSNLIPGKGVVKMGLGIFDDMTKLEKHTKKKIKLTPLASKNIASAMYIKGYKEGRADEAKEQMARVSNGETGIRESSNSRNSRKRKSGSNRFSNRRRRRR